MKSMVAGILQLYRKLARALPEDFRRRHGIEMVQATEDLIRYTAGHRSPRAFVSVVLRVFVDLFWHIPIEHGAEVRQDVRYGVRMLGRSPGFTVAATVSLGIGIGLTVSMFSQLELILFRPIPDVRNPATLVTLRPSISHSDYEHLRDHSVFSEAAAYMAPVPFKFTADGESQRLWGHVVTPNYFAVLGAGTSIGRVFDENETGIVISHRLWKSHFGGDPQILSKTVRLNGHPVTVTGVGSPDFTGAAPMAAAADIWLSTAADPGTAPELSTALLRDRKVAAFRIIGRLKEGITQAKAQSTLDAIIKQLDGNPTDQNQRGRRVTVMPGGKILPIPDESFPVMFGVPFLIGALSLWIACSNVGTMLLARGGPRRKEIAIRLAMGASRPRIVRQLITESLMLASIGGIAGWLFAVWSNSTLDWMRPLLPGYVNVDLRLDWRALIFTVFIVAVSSILFGLAPALQAARGNVMPGLKSAGELFESRKYRWFSSRNMLVLQQVAGSLMLVLLTGFVALGFQRSGTLDLGFSPENIHVMSLDPIRDGYHTEDAAAFLSDLPQRLKRLPGIEEAAIAAGVPVAFFSDSVSIRADDRVGSMRVERVGAGFLETIGVPVLQGRSFERADERSGARMAIINEAMAAANWPGRDAIGRQFDIEGKRYTVAGLTKNFKSAGVLEPTRPGAFLVLNQDEVARPGAEGITVLVRTAPGLDPSAMLRREVERIGPGLTVFNVRPLTDEIAQIMYMIRLTTITYASIGVFGLILAAVGLAGLTAYTVAQRTKEIGIRMALGARRHDVLRLVLKEGAALVVVGTVIGHGSAWAATRGLGAFFDAMTALTETSTSDPLLVFGAPALLGALTMVSCYLPARRATRIDPLKSLRQE